MTAGSGIEPGSLGNSSTVAIVGGGLGGLRSAEALRHEGYKGRIVVIGQEPFLPYDRPPLSKQFLTGAWGAERVRLREPELLKELGVEWLLGAAAASLDPEDRVLEVVPAAETFPPSRHIPLSETRSADAPGDVHMPGSGPGDGSPGSDGDISILSPGDALDVELLREPRSVRFDACVIATGARPRSLPVPGAGEAGLSGVLSLRSLLDSARLRSALGAPGARVVVIGAGFIGCEVAASATARGADVTLVEALELPLIRVLGEQVGRAAAALHRSHGVELLVSRQVSAVLPVPGTDRVGAVLLADGQRIPANVVVVGIGVSPEVGWLQGSGLVLDDGVVCSETLHAAPRIIAVGDLARWRHPDLGTVRLEHWTNTAEQAAAGAKALLAGPLAASAYAPVPFFWSDEYDRKIQHLGYSSPDDELVVVSGSIESGRFAALYARDGRLTGAVAFSQPRELMRYRRLLGEGASLDEALVLARS